MNVSIEGILPAMLTPFTKNGERVDYDRAAAYAERLLAQGAGGLFVCGTTGEGVLMTEAERKQLVEVVIEAVGKRTTVLAQTGALDTPATVRLTEHAARVGAAAAGIVAPGYYPYDDLSLRRYFTTVAKAVAGFPILMYNIPGCTQNPLNPAFIAQMANDVENIVGVKDSSGSVAHLNAVIRAVPEGFHVINGSDEYGYQAFVSGTKAAVSGTANVALSIYKRVFDHVRKGEYELGMAAQMDLMPACTLLKYQRRMAAYKECLRL